MTSRPKTSFDDITEADFRAYEEVRQGGEYNMYSRMAEATSGLDAETYNGVMFNYLPLRTRFPDVVPAVRRANEGCPGEDPECRCWDD